MVFPTSLVLFASLTLAALHQTEATRQRVPEPKRGRITLTTTHAGFLIPADVVIKDYPLLLRFDGDQFPWSEAKPDGSDISIETDSHVSLPISIEEWNPEARRASMWVRIPTLVGDQQQTLIVQWAGKSELQSQENRVFDASNGFASVLHLGDNAIDTVGTLSLRPDGVSSTMGAIGMASRFRKGTGIEATLENGKTLPLGSQSSTTSAWVRVRKPNGTIVGWGREAAQGKVVMQFRSPAHINMDCYFSDANIRSTTKAPLAEWMNVSHVYTKGETRLYINGRLEATTTGRGAPLSLAAGARMWLGGWYGNYDFDGDIDEVRVSNVARSPWWIGLDADTQGPAPRLTGRLVRSDAPPRVSTKQIIIKEGGNVELTADLGNAEKATWELVSNGIAKTITTDHARISFTAPRVTTTTSMSLRLRTKSGGHENIQIIPVTVVEAISDPDVNLDAPTNWDGRTPAYIRADARSTSQQNYKWHVSGPGVAYEVSGNVLRLDRGFKAGKVTVRVDVDNGGEVVSRSTVVTVTPPTDDPWRDAPALKLSELRNGMFIGRGAGTTGRLVINDSANAESNVEIHVVSSDGIKRSSKTIVDKNGRFSIFVDLPARLTTYAIQVHEYAKGKSTELASVTDVQCGDAFIIMGQSNAVATDFGPTTPAFTSRWIQTFTDRFVPARYRNSDGQSGEIGYWGMELARKLVTKHNIPVCIVNGAVGGTRIDQHQRSTENPMDESTLYGRLLGKVTAAGLTHGIRGIFWHQGENDQGADGPSGGFGHETYRELFVSLSHAWALDYPNSKMTYMFQIWPKSCAMGIDGSDNVLRDVQRQLPDAMDRLAIMSTLGIDPPGGCHYPADGYAAMANLISPLVEYHTYGVKRKQPIGPPRLLSVKRDTKNKSILVVTFDQPIVWMDSLRSEFLIDGKRGQVVRGAVKGNTLELLTSVTTATKLTYLDSATWSQQRLLRGKNGIAALTFAGVAIR